MGNKRRLPLSIPCPYDLRWDEMPEEEGGRHCDRWDRHVFDFSLLTEEQATEVKRLSGGPVCRTVHLDEEGAPIYARKALRKVVQTAAGVVLSVSLAASDDAAATSAREETVQPAATPAVAELTPATEAPAEDPPAVAETPPVEVAVQEPVEPEAEPDPEPEAHPRRRRPRRPRNVARMRSAPADVDPIAGLEF